MQTKFPINDIHTTDHADILNYIPKMPKPYDIEEGEKPSEVTYNEKQPGYVSSKWATSKGLDNENGPSLYSHNPTIEVEYPDGSRGPMIFQKAYHSKGKARYVPGEPTFHDAKIRNNKAKVLKQEFVDEQGLEHSPDDKTPAFFHTNEKTGVTTARFSEHGIATREYTYKTIVDEKTNEERKVMLSATTFKDGQPHSFGDQYSVRKYHENGTPALLEQHDVGLHHSDTKPSQQVIDQEGNITTEAFYTKGERNDVGDNRALREELDGGRVRETSFQDGLKGGKDGFESADDAIDAKLAAMNPFQDIVDNFKVPTATYEDEGDTPYTSIETDDEKGTTTKNWKFDDRFHRGDSGPTRIVLKGADDIEYPDGTKGPLQTEIGHHKDDELDGHQAYRKQFIDKDGNVKVGDIGSFSNGKRHSDNPDEYARFHIDKKGHGILSNYVDGKLQAVNDQPSLIRFNLETGFIYETMHHDQDKLHRFGAGAHNEWDEETGQQTKNDYYEEGLEHNVGGYAINHKDKHGNPTKQVAALYGRECDFDELAKAQKGETPFVKNLAQREISRDGMTDFRLLKTLINPQINTDGTSYYHDEARDLMCETHGRKVGHKTYFSRSDGPSQKFRDGQNKTGCEYWKLNNEFHRDDDFPARIEEKDGHYHYRWYKNGKEYQPSKDQLKKWNEHLEANGGNPYFKETQELDFGSPSWKQRAKQQQFGQESRIKTVLRVAEDMAVNAPAKVDNWLAKQEAIATR